MGTQTQKSSSLEVFNTALLAVSTLYSAKNAHYTYKNYKELGKVNSSLTNISNYQIQQTQILNEINSYQKISLNEQQKTNEILKKQQAENEAEKLEKKFIRELKDFAFKAFDILEHQHFSTQEERLFVIAQLKLTLKVLKENMVIIDSFDDKQFISGTIRKFDKEMGKLKKSIKKHHFDLLILFPEFVCELEENEAATSELTTNLSDLDYSISSMTKRLEKIKGKKRPTGKNGFWFMSRGKPDENFNYVVQKMTQTLKQKTASREEFQMEFHRTDKRKKFLVGQVNLAIKTFSFLEVKTRNV